MCGCEMTFHQPSLAKSFADISDVSASPIVGMSHNGRDEE